MARRAAGLGFNSGVGALRDGVRANTSVGRWLRLYQRNVFGFTAAEHDKSTFGNSFRVVLCEDACDAHRHRLGPRQRRIRLRR